MSNLSFRKATPSDVHSVLGLVRSAYRGDASRAGWTTEADLVRDDRIDEGGLLDKINEPHGRVLLAFAPSPSGTTANSSSTSSTSSATAEKEEVQQQQHQQLLACCELVHRPAPGNVAYLGLFSVAPALQNGGIGRKVLAEAERLAREAMGARVMEMHVLWMRRELIAYYERRGYKVMEGETLPFPYEHLVNPQPGVRQDLYFMVMRKDLVV